MNIHHLASLLISHIMFLVIRQKELMKFWDYKVIIIVFMI